jgi:hypothetical protein
MTAEQKKIKNKNQGQKKQKANVVTRRVGLRKKREKQMGVYTI